MPDISHLLSFWFIYFGNTTERFIADQIYFVTIIYNYFWEPPVFNPEQNILVVSYFANLRDKLITFSIALTVNRNI